MKTLDEAIKHCEEVANSSCSDCAAEHRQLATWLKQVKFMDELVETFKKFNGCFIDLCEVCHRKCPVGPDTIAMDLTSKMYEYEKIRNPAMTKEEYKKMVSNPIFKDDSPINA